jgi:hypothetical protein
MATGKLSISRGNPHAPDPGPAGPRLTVVPRAEEATPAEAPACDPRLVRARSKGVSLGHRGGGHERQ